MHGKQSRTASNASAQSVVLSQVLGFTTSSNAGLAFDCNQRRYVYLAGCTVVLSSVDDSTQTFIQSPYKKTVTCLDLSICGKFLVTGESGHLPMVRLWSTNDGHSITEFAGHHFRINSVKFSPNQAKLIASVGSSEDNQVYLWDRISKRLLASAKHCHSVNAMVFGLNATFFVTVGNRFVRFWDLSDMETKSSTNTIPLQFRNSLLQDKLNSNFVDVTLCSNDQSVDLVSCHTESPSTESLVLALTANAMLVQFTECRKMTRSTQVSTAVGMSLASSAHYLLVGGADGFSALYDGRTLQPLLQLPRPHSIGSPLSVLKTSLTGMDVPGQQKPAIIATQLDLSQDGIVVNFLADRSIYVWELHGALESDSRAQLRDRKLYHSRSVWNVEPNGPRSFLTCSDDCTVRAWSVSNASPSVSLRDLIYTGETDLSSLMVNEKQGSVQGVSASHCRNGIRCLKVSPSGEHLAVGNHAGSVKIFSLATGKLLQDISAHDSEVLSLEYFQSELVPELTLFCTASRDRMIHVFDPHQNYLRVQTLAEHSGAVFAIRVIEDASENEIRLVSCGTDRSLLIRSLEPDEDGQAARFLMNHHLYERYSQLDATVVTPGSTTGGSGAHAPSPQKQLAVACQDRRLRIYNVREGKQERSFRGSQAEDGFVLRCAADPTGSVIATTSSDRQVNLYDFATGNMLSSMHGHSEVPTGLCFLPDGGHLVSSSSDGCVFVWDLSKRLTTSDAASSFAVDTELASRVTESDEPSPSTSAALSAFSFTECEAARVADLQSELGDQVDQPSFRFSVSALPAWARRKVVAAQSDESLVNSATTPIEERSIESPAVESVPSSRGPQSHTLSKGEVMTTSTPSEAFPAFKKQSLKLSSHAFSPHRDPSAPARPTSFAPDFLEFANDLPGKPSPSSNVKSSQRSNDPVVQGMRDTRRRLEMFERQKTQTRNCQSAAVNSQSRRVSARPMSSTSGRSYATPTLSSSRRTTEVTTPPAKSHSLQRTGSQNSLTVSQQRAKWIHPTAKVTSSTISGAATRYSQGKRRERLITCPVESSDVKAAHSTEKAASEVSTSGAKATLTTVRTMLDQAIEECQSALDSDCDEQLEEMRGLVTEELDWRFARLRAQLGLAPLSVEPGVAKLLVADIVDRIIPQLRMRDSTDCTERNARPQAEDAISSSTEDGRHKYNNNRHTASTSDRVVDSQFA